MAGGSPSVRCACRLTRHRAASHVTGRCESIGTVCLSPHTAQSGLTCKWQVGVHRYGVPVASHGTERPHMYMAGGSPSVRCACRLTRHRAASHVNGRAASHVNGKWESIGTVCLSPHTAQSGLTCKWQVGVHRYGVPVASHGTERPHM
ncbi:hypothetical protein ACOMHN_031172 [Nucella lapillus]